MFTALRFEFMRGEIVETDNYDGTYNLELITAISHDTIYTLRLFPGFNIPEYPSLGCRKSYQRLHFYKFLLKNKTINHHWREAYNAEYPYDYSNTYLNLN